MGIDAAFSCVMFAGSCAAGVVLGLLFIRVIVRAFPAVNSVPTESDKEASY